MHAVSFAPHQPPHLVQIFQQVLAGGTPCAIAITRYGHHAPRAVSYTHLDVYKRQALAAANQMPNVPASRRGHGHTSPGPIASNMPMIAVNTISATTRGLVNVQYLSLIHI